MANNKRAMPQHASHYEVDDDLVDPILSEITDEAGSMVNNLNHLEQRINHLADRLEMVMTDDTPKGADKAAETSEARRSPLARSLQGQNDILEYQIGRLESIIARIAI